VAGDTAVSDPAIKAWVGRLPIELTGLARWSALLMC
jgi:hypothetical protein